MNSKNCLSPIGMVLALVVAVSNFGCGGGQSTRLLKVTTTSLPGGTGGSAYDATLQESGGIAPFTWSLSSGSSLPAGLSLSSDGTISGTPTAAGTSNFTVQVADSGNPPLTATANLSITVIVLPVSITTTSLADGTVDSAYKQQVQATGGVPPYTWSIATGSLPSWATLNSAAGTISGIPSTTGTANFTVQVADAETPALTATQPLALTVIAGSSANDSELSGHYAFLFDGFDDATGSQVAIAGSFTADGKGNIAAGIEDENGPSGPTLSLPFTGTYNIGSDNRGAFTISTASGAKTYALVLSSINSGVAQKARFVEFDDTTGTNGTRGSGVMRAQDTTAFTLASVTGPYAFGFAGQDGTGKRNAIVGSFTADGAGNIPSGTADQNVAGTATNPTLTGIYNAPSVSNGRTSMALTPSGASSLDLSAYVVSAKELLVMTTNAFSSDGVVSGAMLSQTSKSFSKSSLNAPAVYYEAGTGNGSPATTSSVEIALSSPDGSGNLTVTFDGQNGGGVTSNQTFATTYSVASDGRVTIPNYYGIANSPLRILYLVDLNKAFFLDTGGAVGFGFLEPQAPGPFSNASLSGTLPAATVAPSVSPDPNGCGLATLDAAGNFTEVASVSLASGLFVDQTTSGTYSVAANGRGVVSGVTITSAAISASMLGVCAIVLPLFARGKSRRKRSRVASVMLCLMAVIATTLGGCVPPQLVFYVVSPTKAVMIHQATGDQTPVVTIIEK